ncbi:MAG: hypothetical protein R8J84_01675 [Mariprofundales bacterium]
MARQHRRRSRKRSGSRKQRQIKQYAWILVAMIAGAGALAMIEEWLEDDGQQAIQASRQHQSSGSQRSSLFNSPSQRQKKGDNDEQMKKLEQLKMMADQMGITQGADKEQLKKMAERMGIK